MGTSTIYSNAQYVIVDIGSAPATAPWLKQTTYLIDSSGRTTAFLAQTGPATEGVTITAVPYTSSQPTQGLTITPVPYKSSQPIKGVTTTTVPDTSSAQVSTTSSAVPFELPQGPTTTAPPSAQHSTKAPPHTPRNVIVDAAVIGVLAGIAIVVALVHYTCRRIRMKRLETKRLLQTSQDTAEEWTPVHELPHWDMFVKETQQYQTRSEESAMGFREGNGVGLGIERNQVVSWPNIPELREKNEQLARVRSGSSNTYDQWPAGYPLPAKPPAQANIGQPTSILKRPAPDGIPSVAQGTVGNEDERGAGRISATRNIARAKKGVRFGVNQIREFGRSPFIGHGSEA